MGLGRLESLGPWPAPASYITEEATASGEPVARCPPGGSPATQLPPPNTPPPCPPGCWPRPPGCWPVPAPGAAERAVLRVQAVQLLQVLRACPQGDLLTASTEDPEGPRLGQRWCPLGPQHPAIAECRVHQGGMQCWTSRPQPWCPDEPEGDEVGVEEGRTQEGAQQPQDGRARGHVPPPEPGQEGLERSRRCWPAAPHCSPHPALGWACTPGSSRSLARPPPPALPPGAPSCGARAFSARRPGSGSDTRGGNAMGPAEGVGGCLPGPEHPLPVSPTLHGWVVGGRWMAAAVWGKSARAPTACLPPHPGSPARPAAHLYPIVGEESLGVGLGGQVQAGGPAPAAAAADQQGEGAALAVAVALGEEAWPGGRPLARRPRHPPQPAPAPACGTWLPTLLARPFRLLSGPWEPRAP